MVSKVARAGTTLALALLVGGGAGCGRGESAEDRQLAQIRDELDRVQAERDAVDQRLAALEVKASDDHATPTPSAGPAVGAAPPLRVVRLRPDGTQEDVSAGAAVEAPDDAASRPTLRLAGNAPYVSNTTARGKNRRRGADTDAPDDGSGGTASLALSSGDDAPGVLSGGGGSGSGGRPSALDPEAKRAYDAALALVNAKKYQAALDAFAGFLMKWPDHPNADNAMYWRGECYFAQGQMAQAAEQFEGTVARFPLGNKAPDALLKLGMSREKLGNHDGARQAYDQLARDFPKSEAARRIPAAATPTTGSRP